QKENQEKPAASWARQRLRRVDELTAKLAEFLNQAREPVTVNSASRVSKLVAQYEGDFAPVGDFGFLPPDQRQLVQDYFQAYARASEEFLQRQGRIAAASGTPLVPLAEVCFVLPVLT